MDFNEELKEAGVVIKSAATKQKLLVIMLKMAKEYCEVQKIKCAENSTANFTQKNLTWSSPEEEIGDVTVSVDYTAVLKTNNVVDDALEQAMDDARSIAFSQDSSHGGEHSSPPGPSSRT